MPTIPSSTLFTAQIHEAAYLLSIDLTEHQCHLILQYIDLLLQWNRTYNLTAVRDPQAILIQHVFDALAIIPALSKSLSSLHNPFVLDVGTGAGLPGLILAITQPEWKLVLNDVIQKKTAFLTQAVATLGLNNVKVITKHVEQIQLVSDLNITSAFDAIISRAFAKLSTFSEATRHLIKSSGFLWAMKGVFPEQEIADLPSFCHVQETLRIQVPHLEAERHLVQLKIEKEN